MGTGRIVAVLATLTLVACSGGGGTRQAGPATTGSPGASTSRAPSGGGGHPTTTRAAGAATPTTAPGPGGPASPTPTTGGAGATTAPAPAVAHVALDAPCVRRGPAGAQQGLAVSGAPSAIIIYSTSYSDGSNEVANRSYQSGYGSVRTDAAGNAHAVWVVPATAPAGRAVVHVAGSVKVDAPALPFELVDPGGRC